MPGSRLTALGHHQPARVLTNADLEGMVDTSDEWIRRRTGIVTRHIADGSVADLATEAAAKALAAAGLDPGEIGMVIVATCSAIDRCPSIAAQVAGRLGIPAPVCFDLNNGCAGFCTALATADHAIRAGAARHALVIGAEKMSDVTDWTDRGTCVLLGDGAGAAVLSTAETPGLGPVVWGSDPARRHLVRLVDAWQPAFAQDGQSVFRWAARELPAVAAEACHRAGIATTDLAGVVTHQANLRIVEALTDRLDLRDDVAIGKDVVDSGNTSAASVPLALSKMVGRGELPSGEPVLLFAFGGGLSWAGQVVTCP
ncbi:3-oxoacyl-[acyl-carrier-protein] synthase III [Amycolatopsis mediterranei S699]|uniref:Beta-ketoacyl-[acyl-carrier-protein] synthase III n=3 Tax=Amycolatopsis mediterranei TaxID=33910 RepID=A0A0H3D190_AMYMU|nr:beta-ketoacyl-ACP synthase III [Amycolatopsis mediterranei]ADJ44699.1 3-oxoacyl-[acyl-carrier-protein] synthase III [Amycolatopsis mediterranei U32]AEK41439.1 3-oxoacyl-(acyl carrier protein) synthase III [Amycolatopsis mediterranei S699]AFO76410.1 3-oxoacyl-[acyl-carrier-protein] synthase III [Amycolatopsis mediterranei S699]AGT83539.1 3-oxoacyl-[acyl-carrier-protein] synthase III [Amycolatopsis mediterranei RB]KDO06943.1 3-oxoacyl-ACP synthase [Amycolatopsis mediterranei]